MVNKAKACAWLEENQFDFIITGEVVGQPPPNHNGLQPCLLLRANLALMNICFARAKYLSPTLAEREGWIDRESLFSFHGRSRKP